MSFTSPIFLFAFLPLTVIVYQLVRSTRCRNILWIAARLLFYAFGDLRHLPLLLGSCLLHYGAGRYLIAREKECGLMLGLCVVLDLAVLALYKVRGTLPLGISFYTFQAISYVADTYKNPADGTKSLREALQYLTFFPQLTAGPFLKFSALRPYLDSREVSWQKTRRARGALCAGSAKRCFCRLLRQSWPTRCFRLPPSTRSARGQAQSAIACSCILIFPATAIWRWGWGLLFGVQLPENFQYPYCAGSVSEFWRRWHMTLSGWFRDYIYIPLGGSRKGSARTVLNKLAVFLATGLWHGTGWTFVLWGLWHGVFCGAEMLLDRKHTLKTRWHGHLYTLLVVIFGFVLFRAESLPQALALLRAMLTGFAPVESCRLALQNLLTAGTVFWCLAGAAACLPLWPLAKKRLAGSRWLSPALDVLTVLGLLLCLMQLASHSFQPFIYAGF